MKCVDMHVHLGVSKDGAKITWPEIQKLMDRYEISHAVLFPIDERHPGPGYRQMNSKVAAIAKKDKRVIGFCRLDLKESREAFKEFERSLKLGLRGVKLHPRSENFSPAEAEDIMPLIEKKRLPVVLHTSHEPHCHPLAWQALFLKHKKISFILAHAGKDAFLEAGKVASRCPNVYLDTSTLSYRRTALLLKEPGPDKIVFASDIPYSHPAIELLKFDLILGGRSSMRRRIFEENPKRILGGLL